MDADSAEGQAIVDAAELLIQDVQRNMDGDADGVGDVAASDGGEVSLKEGVSKDRMVSVHDPETRHDRKSKRLDGHKAAVLVDTYTQLLTAVDVLVGNAWDSTDALELVERSEASSEVPVAEAMGDTAYGDGGTRQVLADAGRKLLARARAAPTGSVSQRKTSSSTWWEEAAPVPPNRSPAPSYPRANEPTVLERYIVGGPSEATVRCARAVCCDPSALRPKAGRDGRC